MSSFQEEASHILYKLRPRVFSSGMKQETPAERVKAVEEALAAITELVDKLIGEKEYYHEHYPFVRTNEQHIEAKEKIARDELRIDLREKLRASQRANLRKD